MQKAISKYWPVFVLPTLIAFIIGQDHIVSGMTAGSVKS